MIILQPSTKNSDYNSKTVIIVLVAAASVTTYVVRSVMEILLPEWSELATTTTVTFAKSVVIGVLYFLILRRNLIDNSNRSNNKKTNMLMAISLAVFVATAELAMYPVFYNMNAGETHAWAAVIDWLITTIIIIFVVIWFNKLNSYIYLNKASDGGGKFPLHHVAVIAITTVLVLTAIVNAVPAIVASTANKVESRLADLLDESGRQRMLSQRIGRYSAQSVSRSSHHDTMVRMLEIEIDAMGFQAAGIDEKLQQLEKSANPFGVYTKATQKDRLDESRRIMLQNAMFVVTALRENNDEKIEMSDQRLQQSIDRFLPLQEALISQLQQTHYRFRTTRNDLSLIWILFSSLALFSIGFAALGPIAAVLRMQERKHKTQAADYRRLISAIGYAKSAIALLDATGKIVWANPALAEIVGADGPVHGRTLIELLLVRDASPDAIARVQGIIKNPARIRTECSIVNQMGKRLELDLEIEVSTNVPGSGGGFTAILTDRTQQVNTSNFLRAVFDGAAQGIVVQKSNGEIIDANVEAQRLLGLSLDQLKGLNSLDSRWRALDSDGNDLSGENHPAMIALRTNKPVPATIMGIESGDGERRWLLVNCSLSIDPASSERIVLASFADVTKDRMREQQLEDAYLKSQRSLSELAEYKSALNQHWIVSVADKNGLIVYVNESFQQISGYEETELIGSNHNVVNSGFHAKSVFDDMWNDIVQGRTWRGEICNRSKDGSLYWLDSTIIPTHNSDGSIRNFVSIASNITQQITNLRLLEESRALNDRKTSLLEMTLTHMSQGISVYDKDGRIVIWNDKYTSMYGMKPDEVAVGRTLEELLMTQKANGNFDGNPSDLIKNIQLSVDSGSVLSSTTPQRSGMLIKAIHSPTPDGGHVATHEDVTEREQFKNKITHAAHHDLLTGLPNRAMIRATMTDALLATGADGDNFSVMLIDLDRFKSVNDTFGHAVGDTLLKHVAKRMRANVRMDDVVARLGGDEFAIYFAPANSQLAMTASVADRLVHDLCMPYEIDGLVVTIGASIGVAIAPDHGNTCDELFRSADIALYHVKENGRQAFRIFDGELEAELRERREIEAELREAVANEALELYLQPYYDVLENRIVGAECLIRWHHPERGFISPDLFIPIAEETGLIRELGDWIIRTAIEHAARLPEHVQIAINVSAAQFGHGRLVDLLINSLIQTRVNPRRIEIEVTETVLLRDDPALIAELDGIKALNISVALDDFGTGYSSMKYLKMFKFDKIKIDKSFVNDMVLNEQNSSIIAAIANLARSLGMSVTAEGVETQEQLQLVQAAGCYVAQGYYFARPMPIADFSELLAVTQGGSVSLEA